MNCSGFEMDKIDISTDKNKLNLNYIHNFLRTAYWSKEIPYSIVEKAIENSLCFGVFKNENQIGFARVITDYATFAYLADVFIDENEQGKGYGKQLLEKIIAHPELQGLRRWHLITLDAQGFYQEFGFKNPDQPEWHMEIKDNDIYVKMKL